MPEQALHKQIQSHIQEVLHEFKKSGTLQANDLFVVGCSTSEIIGEDIGSAGSEEVAAILFGELVRFREETGIQLAFQCCEHLNRALVMEQDTFEKMTPSHEEVTVIPAPEAGGSMATHAFRTFDHPVVIETVQADAGMDIGDTFIGMHLKHVAVPIRLGRDTIGSAHVTAARTRPKFIGGERAHYYRKAMDRET